MGSYLDMVNRISDESLRTGMDSQIKLCIQDAIRHYEGERFWFNQFRDRIFMTVPGQEFYGIADLSDIPDILELDAVTLSVGPTRKTLVRCGYLEIEAMNADSGSRGEPTHFAYWGQQIRLYPIPSLTYPVRLAGLFKLAGLVGDGDQNAWTGEAEELIRCRAKSIFYSQYLRDDANAGRAAALEASARERLSATTTRRLAAGEIRPAL
jgi:hypothetical protein